MNFGSEESHGIDWTGRYAVLWSFSPCHRGNSCCRVGDQLGGW